MGSSFPGGYDNFSAKTDNVDINYAADINRLQDAVTAIEQTLGSGILTLQKISYNPVNVSNLLQEDPEALTQTNSSSTVSSTINFASLVDYLLWLGQNQNRNCINLQANTQWIQPTTGDFSSQVPDLVNLVNSGSSGDPDGLWNGAGFTIPTAGFWELTGYVQYAATATGTFQGAISLGTNDWSTGMDSRNSAGPEVVTLTARRVQWIAAGTVVALRSNHNTGVPQRISSGYLSGTLLRQS